MHLPTFPRKLLASAVLLLAGAAQAQAPAPAPAPAPATPADEAAALLKLRDTTLALIEALVQQGLLTRERADALLRHPPASTAVPAGTWGAPRTAEPGRPVQRVVHLPETMKAELRESIKLDVLAQAREEGWADARQIPEWSRRIRLSGDLRVRAQSELFDRDNLAADEYQLQNLLASTPAWAPDLVNTTHDRHRLTLRARLAADIRLGSDTTAGLRLSTGSSSGPTSSSQTLGSGFNKASLVLDRAWLRWEPRHDVRLHAGRMANPFFGTDLLWPDDLSLDGLAGSAELTLASGLYAYGHAGAFALEESGLSSRDKWLLGLQAGLDWTLNHRHQLRIGLAVYDFHGVAGVRESAPAPSGAAASTTPYRITEYARSLRLKGNTLINLNDPSNTGTPVWGLASKFRPVNLSLAHAWKPFDDDSSLQALTTLDWVKNIGFDLADIERRANDVRVRDVLEKTSGLQLRLQLGHLRLAERGQWQLHAALRRFERDAWLDGLTDTSWHGGGGTNYQGWSLGGQYAFDGATTLGLRWLSTRNLDDRVTTTTFPLGTLSGAPLKVDQLQIDLATRF
ncbi:MAG: putative porin [Burkholderiaceae bacterium]|nr:putative porin [Burkholderiaceae bacterium]